MISLGATETNFNFKLPSTMVSPRAYTSPLMRMRLLSPAMRTPLRGRLSSAAWVLGLKTGPVGAAGIMAGAETTGGGAGAGVSGFGFWATGWGVITGVVDAGVAAIMAGAGGVGVEGGGGAAVSAGVGAGGGGS